MQITLSAGRRPRKARPGVVTRIAQRPDRHREAVGMWILVERVAEEVARGCIQVRWASAPRLVCQARTPLGAEAVVPGADAMGGRSQRTVPPPPATGPARPAAPRAPVAAPSGPGLS